MWEVLTHEIAISHDVFTNNEFSTEIETIQKALPFIIIHEQKQQQHVYKSLNTA